MTEETILARCYGATSPTTRRLRPCHIQRTGRIHKSPRLFLPHGRRLSLLPTARAAETMTFTEECADATRAWLIPDHRHARAPHMPTAQSAIFRHSPRQSPRFTPHAEIRCLPPLVTYQRVHRLTCLFTAPRRSIPSYLPKPKAEAGTLKQEDLTSRSTSFAAAQACPTLSLKTPTPLPTPSPHIRELYGYVNRRPRPRHVGVILEIRRERAIELVNEGLRYSDLCRWRGRKDDFCCRSRSTAFTVPGEGRYDMDGDGKIDFWCVHQPPKPVAGRNAAKK